MRAKYISEVLNEKFTEDSSDVIHDMGIGKTKYRAVKQKGKDSYKILQYSKPNIFGVERWLNVPQPLSPYKKKNKGVFGQLRNPYSVETIDLYVTSFDGNNLKDFVEKWPLISKYLEYVKEKEASLKSASDEKRRKKKEKEEKDKYEYFNESIFEKFNDKTDPIKDMDIGYPERQTKTMSWQILKFIEEKGQDGASLKEIQFFIWTELEGHDPKEFYEKRATSVYSKKYEKSYDTSARKTRGHWNTQLLGGPNYHQGLLHKYCNQNPSTKRWILKHLPKPKERFYDWKH